jgi:hypothetical protein
MIIFTLGKRRFGFCGGGWRNGGAALAMGRGWTCGNGRRRGCGEGWASGRTG